MKRIRGPLLKDSFLPLVLEAAATAGAAHAWTRQWQEVSDFVSCFLHVAGVKKPKEAQK